jgi:hypothetical protein
MKYFIEYVELAIRFFRKNPPAIPALNGPGIGLALGPM